MGMAANSKCCPRVKFLIDRSFRGFGLQTQGVACHVRNRGTVCVGGEEVLIPGKRMIKFPIPVKGILLAGKISLCAHRPSLSHLISGARLTLNLQRRLKPMVTGSVFTQAVFTQPVFTQPGRVSA